MDKKIILFPGWMKSVRFYDKYEGFDIWKTGFNMPENIDADFLVAHSLGVNFLLELAPLEKNHRIILLNPMISKGNPLRWIYSWLRFVIFGGPKIDPQMNPLNIFRGLYLFFKLKKNKFESLKNFPKEKIVVIRGKKDRSFCDEKEAAIFKELGIKVIEAENLGHEWNTGFNEYIKTAIDKFQD